MTTIKEYLLQRICPIIPPPQTVGAEYLADCFRSPLEKYLEYLVTWRYLVGMVLMRYVVVRWSNVYIQLTFFSFLFAYLSTYICISTWSFASLTAPNSPGPTTQNTASTSSLFIEYIRAQLPTLRRPTIPRRFLPRIQTFLSSPITSLLRWYDHRSPDAHDLTGIALSASALLSDFATSPPSPDGRFTTAHKRWLHAALVGVFIILENVRIRNGDADLGSGLTVDAGCVVCCEEVVDMVLMPCRHMVVCGVMAPSLFVMWDANAW